MTIFTYARVSTLDQNTDLQEKALKTAYPEATFRLEKKTGTSLAKREILKLILDIMGNGDKLVVWKLDRLARDMRDLIIIIEQINNKGAALEILDQKIDTSTATGKAFLQMLGVFAEFETNIRRERQKAGIEVARAKGKHLGRKPSLTDSQQQNIGEKSRKGMNPSQLSKEFGVSRATIYNVLKRTA